MFRHAIAESSASKRDIARSTTVMGQWLLGAYAVFFAVVAPFICWGSVGDPDHNHAGAHFVFSEELAPAIPHSSKSHGHDYCSHDPMLRHNRMAPDQMAAAPLPDLSLIHI